MIRMRKSESQAKNGLYGWKQSIDQNCTRGAALVHSIAIIESKREAAQETKYGQANAVSKIRQHQDEDEDESQQKAENWLGWEPEAELEEPQSRAMTKQS